MPAPRRGRPAPARPRRGRGRRDCSRRMWLILLFGFVGVCKLEAVVDTLDGKQPVDRSAGVATLACQRREQGEEDAGHAAVQEGNGGMRCAGLGAHHQPPPLRRPRRPLAWPARLLPCRLLWLLLWLLLLLGGGRVVVRGRGRELEPTSSCLVLVRSCYANDLQGPAGVRPIVRHRPCCSMVGPHSRCCCACACCLGACFRQQRTSDLVRNGDASSRL